MPSAKRDSNRIVVAQAETNDSDRTPTPWKVDPITKRVLVDVDSSQGDTGVTGAKGDTGTAGSAGAQGDTGATGSTGAKGDTGSTGAKGDTGTQGDTGATGNGIGSGSIVGIILAEEPPSSNFATRDTRNNHTVWDFDDTTDEEMAWKFQLSPDYSGGGLTVTLSITGTTATSGNAVFQVDIERVTSENQDIDSDGYVGYNSSGAVALPTTSGNVKKITVTFTDGADMDSLAAGEAGRIRVRRDADDTSATDSVTGDIELWGVPIVTET